MWTTGRHGERRSPKPGSRTPSRATGSPSSCSRATPRTANRYCTVVRRTLSIERGRARSRPSRAGTAWRPLIHVSDGRGLVTLGGEATFFDPRTGTPLDGLELTSDTTVVDAGGADVWTLRGPYASETTVGNTACSFEENALVATTESNDVRWRWPLPERSDGFTESGRSSRPRRGCPFSEPIRTSVSNRCHHDLVIHRKHSTSNYSRCGVRSPVFGSTSNNWSVLSGA